MSTLTHLANGFEKLLARLPGPVRKPVENEWRPIRELFLRQRPARLLAIGAPGTRSADAVRILFAMEQGITEAGVGPWRTYLHRGALEFAVVENEAEAREAALSAEPDVLLFLDEPAASLPWTAGFAAFVRERFGKPLPAFTVTGGREATLAAIARALPLEARLEFARVSGEKTAQEEIAAMLTRSTAAVCTAIGAQPIPLADLPILTTLQVLMVGGIIHTTGRAWGLPLVRDFLAALGVNIGLGFLLREGARAAVKLLPGWGNAISGGVAGAGTYAIGRAATAYFIHGVPLGETRRRFRLFRKRKPELPG